MKQKFTKAPKLPFPFDSPSKIDTLRIVLLTLFIPCYAAFSFGWFTFGSTTMGEYFPTIPYLLCDLIIILQIAIPCITAVLLLVKSFDHWISNLRIQVTFYGIIALLYLSLLTLTNRDGFGFAFLLMIGLAFLIIFAAQLIVIGIREIIRKKIGDRKKERKLGFVLLGASILVMVPVFLFLPSHRQVGKELNKVLQDPGEVHLVDNYLDNPIVAAIPREEWDEILTTIEVDTPFKQESRDRVGDLVFGVSVYTAEHPDREIRILWWDRDNLLQIYYRNSWYYADAGEFAAKLQPYLSAQAE